MTATDPVARMGRQLAAAEQRAAGLRYEADRLLAGLAVWGIEGDEFAAAAADRTPLRTSDRRRRAIRRAADAEYQARVAEQRAAWLRARIRAHRKATA